MILYICNKNFGFSIVYYTHKIGEMYTFVSTRYRLSQKFKVNSRLTLKTIASSFFLLDSLDFSSYVGPVGSLWTEMFFCYYYYLSDRTTARVDIMVDDLSDSPLLVKSDPPPPMSLTRSLVRRREVGPIVSLSDRVSFYFSLYWFDVHFLNPQFFKM